VKPDSRLESLQIGISVDLMPSLVLCKSKKVFQTSGYDAEIAISLAILLARASMVSWVQVAVLCSCVCLIGNLILQSH